MFYKLTDKFSEVAGNIYIASGSSASLQIAICFLASLVAAIVLTVFATFPAQTILIGLLFSVARILYAAFTSK